MLVGVTDMLASKVAVVEFCEGIQTLNGEGSVSGALTEG